MAKKSKARKRKQAQKRSHAAKPVAKQPKKQVSAKPAPEEIVPASEELNEEHNLDAMLNEAAPREPLSQKWIVVALIVVIALLGVVLYVMYQKTTDLKQNTANTGQDQLLNVREGDSNSLQPTGATDGASSPQSTSNPQNTPDNSANQLQPQSSPTPDQLNQAQ
jgi:hypothetical protein